MNPAILIADDEERWRRIVGDFLRTEGYRVLEAADGLQVLELLVLIRREYADAQRKINALVHRLTEEYHYFEYLRDQLAEIDALGADNVFGSSGIKEIKASLARNGYDF